MSYDFMTLSPDDFEALVADLLSRSWRTQLEIFKPGADGGIDLRSSRVPVGEPHAIVQCKRMRPADVPALLRAMALEKPKLDQLRPSRYVIATSVRLSPRNKDQLLEIVRPWCAGPEDVYGADELNAVLRTFPEVEHRHFKLWMSSTVALERVASSHVFALTDASVEYARAQVSRLVVHAGVTRAQKVVEKEHYAVIVGNPGVGKTTVARILLCGFIDQGFAAAWVSGDVSEAWRLVDSATPGRPLVIVYDDFLGRANFDEKRFNKNEEQSLFTLFEKVAASDNLRLLLTTREYIIADAQRLHGYLDERASNLVKCLVSIEDYSTPQRARMLFNHLYFSDLPKERLEALVERKAYRQIVHHRHFNPRIIESISKAMNSRAMSTNEFVAFVLEELDDPSKIWAHAFNYELGPVAREILAVLWSFNGLVTVDDVLDVLKRWHLFCDEIEFGLAFEAALKQVDGNFVVTNRYEHESGRGRVHVLGFQNPSAEEFVQRWLHGQSATLMRLADTAISIRQIARLGDISPQQTAAFKKLREKLADSAFRVEGRKDGRPAGLQRMYGGNLVDVWSAPEADTASDACELFRVLRDGPRSDGRRTMLEERMQSPVWWSFVIEGLSRDGGDDGVAASVERLVHEMAGQCVQNVKEATGSRLRDSLLAFIEEDESRSVPGIGTTRRLLECITELNPTALMASQARFVAAIDDNAASRCRDIDDADYIQDDSSELWRIGTLLGADFTFRIACLSEEADEKRARAKATAVPVPRPPTIKGDDETDFDIDRLFSTLLERSEQ